MKKNQTIHVEVFHVAAHWNKNAACNIPAYWSAYACDDYQTPRICTESPKEALRVLAELLRDEHGLSGVMRVVNIEAVKKQAAALAKKVFS